MPSEILKLASQGELQKLKDLKSQDPTNFNPNITSKDGMTALHLATQGGHIDTCIWLCENGANINAELYETKIANYGGFTAFFLAIDAHDSAHDMSEFIQYLLCCDGKQKSQILTINATLNTQQFEGYTILHYALRTRKPDLAKIILESTLGKQLLEEKTVASKNTPIMEAGEAVIRAEQKGLTEIAEELQTIISLINTEIDTVKKPQNLNLISMPELEKQVLDVTKPEKSLQQLSLKYFQHRASPYETGTQFFMDLVAPVRGVINFAKCFCILFSPFAFVGSMLTPTPDSNFRTKLQLASTKSGWYAKTGFRNLVIGPTQFIMTPVTWVGILLRTGMTIASTIPKAESRPKLQLLLAQAQQSKQSDPTSTKKIIIRMHYKFQKYANDEGYPTDIKEAENATYQLFHPSNDNSNQNQMGDDQNGSQVIDQYLELYTPKQNV